MSFKFKSDNFPSVFNIFILLFVIFSMLFLYFSNDRHLVHSLTETQLLSDLLEQMILEVILYLVFVNPIEIQLLLNLPSAFQYVLLHISQATIQPKDTRHK